MKYYNYNPQVRNIKNYYQEIENDKNIDGIFVNLVLNREFELLIYMPGINTRIPIYDFLETFKNTKKTIVINMLLEYQLLNDKTSNDIADYNKIFVEKVLRTLEKYNNNFYLCTISTATLYFLKINPIPYKIGTILTKADLGFIDVDFYIFSEYFINISFINELIKNGKTIMIFPNQNKKLELPQETNKDIIYILESSNNI